jgi:hypothetical protein
VEIKDQRKLEQKQTIREDKAQHSLILFPFDCVLFIVASIVLVFIDDNDSNWQQQDEVQQF